MFSWLVLGVAGAAPLTVDDVTAAVIAQNPSLASTRASRESAAAAVLAARGVFDPTLDLSVAANNDQRIGFFQGFPYKSLSRQWDLGAGIGQALPTGTSWTLDVGMNRNYSRFTTDFGAGEQDRIQDAYTGNASVAVTQQLLEGLTRTWNLQSVRRADLQLSLADLSLEQQRQSLLSQASTAYWAWVYQEDLAAIAREAEAAAAEALRVGKARVAQGDLAPVEQTRLEAALVQAEVDRMGAEAAAAGAEDQLLMLMGRGVDEDVSPAATGPTPTPAPSADEAVSAALDGNLDLRLAKARAEQAQLDVRIAKERMLPTWSATVSAGVGSQSDSLGSATSNLFTEPFPTVGLSSRFSVPLGNRAARGARDQALASADGQQDTVAAVEAQLRVDIAAQLRTLATVDRRVALTEANVRLAQETLAAEEARAAVGRAIQKDVLDARTAVARARAEAAKARTDRELAVIELRRLQGRL